MGSIAKYRKRQLGVLAVAVVSAVCVPAPIVWADEQPIGDRELPKSENVNIVQGVSADGIREYPITLHKDGKDVSGRQMDIQLASNKAIMEWEKFNIGKYGVVNFLGEEKWRVLNRVMGEDASVIAGSLKGEGLDVFLVNPHGIVFKGGSQVDVGSLVASAMHLSNADFEHDEKFSFHKQVEGQTINDNARYVKVDSGAAITAKDGYVALLGHELKNRGTIEAHDVVLASGQDVVLKYDDKIDLVVNLEKSGQPVYIDTKNNCVLMSTDEAKDIMSGRIINTGTIKAAGMKKNKAGEIILAAANIELGDKGQLSSEGGKITTAAYDNITVKDGVRVHSVSLDGRTTGEWDIIGRLVTVGSKNKDGKEDNTVSSTVIGNSLRDTDVHIIASPIRADYYADVHVDEPIQKMPDEINNTAVIETAEMKNTVLGKAYPDSTTLTLTAGRNVCVDADITSTAGKLNVILAGDTSKSLGTNSDRGDGANIIRGNIKTNGGNFETSALHAKDGKSGEEYLANGTYFGFKDVNRTGESSKRYVETNGGNISLGGAEVLLATGGTVRLDTTSKDADGNVTGAGIVTINGTVNSANHYKDIDTGANTDWSTANREANKFSPAHKSHLAVVTSALEDAIVSSTIDQQYGKTKEAYVGGHVVAVETNADGTIKLDANGQPTVKRKNGKIVTLVNGHTNTRLIDINKNLDDPENDPERRNGGWYVAARDEKGNVTSYVRYWAWTAGDEAGQIFYKQTMGENIAGKEVKGNSKENFKFRDMDPLDQNGDYPKDSFEYKWFHEDHGVKKDGSYVNFAPLEPNDGGGRTEGSETALAVNHDTYYDAERGNVLVSKWDDMPDGTINILGGSTDIHSYVVESEIGKSSLKIEAGDTLLKGKVGNKTKLNDLTINSTGKAVMNDEVNVVNDAHVQAQGNVDAHAINAGNVISLEGRNVTLNDILTAKAGSNNDAIDIRAQEAFLNMSGSSQVLNVDRENNSHWKVYSDTPYKDDFGSGVGQGNDKEKDLYSDSFAVWGDTGFTYNPVEDRENRFIFKYRPTLTFAAKDLPVKAYDEKWTGLGYPEGYTVTNSLSGWFLRAFRDGQNEAGENALVARGDVMEKIGQVITDSQGFTSEVKGIYPITFKFKDGNALNENTLIAPGYKNEFSGSMSVNGKPEPPVTPVDPPVTPVEPPVTPVEPPVMPADPPVTPVEPSLTPVEPTNIPVDHVISPEVEPPVFEAVNEPQHSIVNLVEKPQIDGRTVAANIVGSASYVTQWSRDGASVDRVLGLQSAELPVFNEKHGKVELYGTYDVTVDPDKVKMKPTAKVLPEPDQPKNQYREYERELTTSKGAGRFRLTYNGSTFDIYPADAEAAAILAAGDGTKNVEVESQALFAAFNEMGITLDDLNGVYTHFEKKQ